VLLVEDRSDVKRYLKEYAISSAENIKYAALKTAAQNNVNTAKAAYKKLEAIVKQYINQKALLNQRFFSRYSRFIQEGTWVSEEYVDDEKYFLDA
jgi:prophage DNA circulation protein